MTVFFRRTGSLVVLLRQLTCLIVCLIKGRPNHHDKYGNMQLRMHWVNGMQNLKITAPTVCFFP